MNDVYVIGAGIHPFGRHEGKTGLDLGVDATKLALEDCGIEWRDVQAAFGGSSASGNADAVLPRMGLTGIQFINVANGCATGGSSVLSAYWAIKAGEFDTALAVGFDKHPRGSFNPDPVRYGLPQWYGETGMMLTTQFFAMRRKRANWGARRSSCGGPRSRPDRNTVSRYFPLCCRSNGAKRPPC